MYKVSLYLLNMLCGIMSLFAYVIGFDIGMEPIKSSFLQNLLVVLHLCNFTGLTR